MKLKLCLLLLRIFFCVYLSVSFHPSIALLCCLPIQDINECIEGTDTCDDVTTNCVNVEGGFTCQCKLGFLMNTATRECEGIAMINSSLSSICCLVKSTQITNCQEDLLNQV